MGSVRLAVAAALAMGLLAGGSSGSTGSGLYGTVRMGPIRPVCQIGVPCDGPVVRRMLVFSRSGRTIMRVRSTAQGTYRIALPSGYYDIRSAAKIGISAQPKPHAVHIRAGHWDRINLFFDTGIR